MPIKYGKGNAELDALFKNSDSSYIPSYTSPTNNEEEDNQAPTLIFGGRDTSGSPAAFFTDQSSYAPSSDTQAKPIKFGKGNAELDALMGGVGKNSINTSGVKFGQGNAELDSLFGTKSNSGITKIVSNGKNFSELYNDAALGVGKVGGWCGTFASTLSTASKVGDSWAEKITHVDKRDNPKPGDKIVAPLGVKNGKGYGHVMVALSEADKDGWVDIVQSNADGRQEKTGTPGVVTYGRININDYNKKYGRNWGFVSGELKVDPFKNGKSQTPNLPSPEVQQTINTAVADVKDYFKGWTNPKKVTNDQAPSPILKFNTEKSVDNAKKLADYVIKNNVEDLQHKKWWIDNPNKSGAWDIITQKQGTFERKIPNTGETISQGKVNVNETPLMKALKSVIDPNSFLNPNATANEIATNSDLKQSLNTIGQELKDRVESKVLTFDQEGNTIVNQSVKNNLLINNPVILGMAKSVYGIGQGFTELSESSLDLSTPKTLVQNSDLGDGLGSFFAGPIYVSSPGGAENLVKGIKNIIFGGIGLATPGGVAFQTATETPVIGPVVNTAFKNWQAWKDLIKKAPGINLLPNSGKELLDLGMDISLFGSAKFLKNSIVPKIKSPIVDFIVNKNVKYNVSEVKKALYEINTGLNAGASKPLKDFLINKLKLAADGVQQKNILRQTWKTGVTLKQSRGFVTWFNEFFKGGEKAPLPVEIKALITDGKKVVAGKMDPVEFTKNARDIMAKGESATLRDDLAKIDVQNKAHYVLNEEGVMPANIIAEARNTLTNMQNEGAKPVINVVVDQNPALQLKTYTYSDNKVGFQYSLNTNEVSVQTPFVGKFESPQLAVKAALESIGQQVERGVDFASDQIRTEVGNIKSLVDKPIKDEKLPWEEGYEEIKKLDTTKMSKEEITSKMNVKIQEYIDTNLNSGKGKGVTQGGLSRDVVTGDVVGRSGRVSNNDTWYKDFYAEKGRAPNKTELKQIAIEHLTNGFIDEAIGVIPADAEFQQLLKASVTAKSQKIKPLPSATNSITKTDISTPQSRLDAINKPVQVSGKIKNSQAYEKVKSRLESENQGSINYSKMNIVKDAAKALNFVRENFELAKKIEFNLELPPEGITRTALSHAVAEIAAEMGDYELQARVESAHSLRLTRAGQEIVAEKGRVDMNSSAHFIKQVLNARYDNIANTPKYLIDSLKGNTKAQTITKIIDSEVNKAHEFIKKQKTKINRAQEILDLLTCK